MKETFNGYTILAKVEKAEPGTARYDELTKAAAHWRNLPAAYPSLYGAIEVNVARELEIERDHGLRVAINPRV